MFLSPALTSFCTLKKQKITKITNLLKYAQNRQKNILELNYTLDWQVLKQLPSLCFLFLSRSESCRGSGGGSVASRELVGVEL